MLVDVNPIQYLLTNNGTNNGTWMGVLLVNVGHTYDNHKNTDIEEV